MSIPELDEVLYRIEVLRLEQRQYEELFEGEESSRDASEVDAIMPASTSELPRSESISTVISADVTSGSTSIVSHATSITSRSSHDSSAPERQFSSFAPKSLLQKSPISMDYERFLAHAEKTLTRAVRNSTHDSPLSMSSPLIMSARKSYAGLRRRFTHFAKMRKEKLVTNGILRWVILGSQAILL